jgi:hypothetical protein
MRTAIVMAAWCLLATLPPITLFFVAPDLQGSRYLYLASIGYAGLVVTLTSHYRGSVAARLFSLGAPTFLIIGGIAGVIWHLGPWQDAAAMRDRIIAAAAANVQVQRCDHPTFQDLPDSVRGAYVFRNGGREALAFGSGTASPAAVTACTFRWDGRELMAVDERLGGIRR